MHLRQIMSMIATSSVMTVMMIAAALYAVSSSSEPADV